MKEIYAALGQATLAADAVGKRSVMKMGEKVGYKYASSEDVISEAREALTSAGLALYCRSARVQPLGTSQVEGGDGVVSTSTQWEAAMVYVLVHSSGESLEIESATPIMPGNGRPMDKALATAKTYDLAYTLRTLLLLPRLDPREIAEEPVDQRREAPAAGPVPGGSDVERLVAGFNAATTGTELDDLLRRTSIAVRSLDNDHPDRVACREAAKAAQARIGGGK